MAPGARIDLGRYDQSWYSRGRSALVIVLWEIVQSLLIHGSLHPMFAWRRFWYRRFGARIGDRVLIRRSVTCNYPWKLSIGDRSWIGDEAVLYALERIHIGSDVVISQRAYLCTGTHDHHDPAFGLVVKPIHVGDGAWVAIDALVMPGVTIGDGALVGARALLTADAAPWTIYLGQPARARGERSVRS
jgi:putative colanic acid biosynthesis acetyltransferase WcaF